MQFVTVIFWFVTDDLETIPKQFPQRRSILERGKDQVQQIIEGVNGLLCHARV
jgi:hypothetical protein